MTLFPLPPPGDRLGEVKVWFVVGGIDEANEVGVSLVCVWQSIRACATAIQAARERPYVNGSMKKNA